MSVLSQQENIVFEWENPLICVSFCTYWERPPIIFPVYINFHIKSELCVELKNMNLAVLYITF